MNKTILIGRVGKDPESKQLSTGTELVTFTMATSERYKDKGGEYVEKTTWHDLKAWSGTAGYIARNVKKGDLISVEGKMEREEWEKDGQKRSKVVIRVDVVIMLVWDRQPRTTPVKLAYPASEPDPDDDLPF